jgi:soluble lytic murein transglycosylase
MKLSIKHFKIVAFFLMKALLLTSFNAASYASDYDHNTLKHASKSEWTQALRSADKQEVKDSEYLTLWMYATADNKKAQLDRHVTWQDMKALIENRDYWPQQTMLKTVFEQKMPFEKSVSGQAMDAVAWFDEHAPETTRGMKIYLSALKAHGQGDLAAKKINDWWPVILIKPDDQAYFLSKYGDMITRDAHIARLSHLIDRGHYTNAKIIGGVLGGQYKKLAHARIVIGADLSNDRAHSDGGLSSAINAVPDALQNDVGLVYDRLKWRRVHKLNDRASDILLDPPSADQISGQESRWWRERHIMLRRYMDDKQYDKAYQLAASHSQSKGVNYSEAEWMAGWLALQFLNKPQVALKHFYAMRSVVKTPISLSRHYYWLGRSFDKLGDKKNADDNYQRASAYPTTYYGLLAAGHVRDARSIKALKSPVLPDAVVDALESDVALNDLFNAAAALAQVDYNNSANQFLVTAGSLADKHELGKYYVAQRAATQDKINISVLLSRQAAMDHIFYAQRYAYPVMSDHLQKVQTDKISLVHGIIRQESLFDTNAQSGAGAMGLMQLIPATARSVAKDLKYGYSKEWLKTRPEYNIALGSSYIDGLLAQYQGAYPLAAAAYNAGPHRVDTWLKRYGDPRQGDINWVDWVELIPYSETRNYVMRVTEGASVYNYILHDVDTASMVSKPNASGLYYGQ